MTPSLKSLTAYITTCGKSGIISGSEKRVVFLSTTIRKYFQQTLTNTHEYCNIYNSKAYLQ